MKKQLNVYSGCANCGGPHDCAVSDESQRFWYCVACSEFAASEGVEPTSAEKRAEYWNQLCEERGNAARESQELEWELRDVQERLAAARDAWRKLEARSEQFETDRYERFRKEPA